MDIENKIKEIFFGVFSNLNDENFSWEEKQEDYLNWDSFAHLELMTGTESKFNIKISPEEALSIRTAQDLVDLVKSRT
ncbi:Acyl carrier protein [Marine Group I thaumarchaeote SCGC AAA799-E16]|uniref:Acyl carrier protein n=2 Tax=Marine Group I TaxID=905826 RepID=A0A087S3E4_9ARCH|nr:Acyl carrier protein [Marine Group I thaumarchaeote SCGC AAA799-E16]KFM20248.1 Acyl carrier protein [Marine Group I thaumarchaeote SCGC RSA3]